MYDFSSISPVLGKRVLYMLSEADVRLIAQERREAGSKTFHGNDPREGAILPGVIVATFGHSTANLQVFLDGNDSYWPTSRGQFDPERNGRWHYVLDGEEITYEQFSALAGPNDVGMGESAVGRVVKTFEPDARSLWVLADSEPVT